MLNTGINIRVHCEKAKTILWQLWWVLILFFSVQLPEEPWVLEWGVPVSGWNHSPSVPHTGTALVRPLTISMDIWWHSGLSANHWLFGHWGCLVSRRQGLGGGIKCFFLFLQPVPELWPDWVNRKEMRQTFSLMSAPANLLTHTCTNSHYCFNLRSEGYFKKWS